MSRILIFGNSGSGKSTLSKKIAKDNNLAYLDLDTLAFNDELPITRKDIKKSMIGINKFINTNKS